MADEQLSSWAKQKWFDDYDLNEVKLKAMIDQFLELQRVTKGLEVNLKGADTLKDVITSQNALVDANGRLVSSFGEVSKTLAQGAAAKDRYNGSTDVVIKTSEKLIRLQGEEAKAQQQINKALQEGEKVRILSGKATLEQAKAETEAAKTKLANLRADQAAEKQARVSVKSNQDLTNEYGLLSKAYNEAALKAKNYSLTLGANNPVTKQATADALAMGQKLKELDASVGQNQRNVGNYSSVLTGYANTLRGLRGPTKLLGEAIGVGAQAADQLRLVIEHSLQGIAAYFRGKEAKAAAETKDTAATVANTVAAEENAAAQTTENVATEVSNSVLKTNVTIKDANVLASKALNTQSKTYTFSLATTTAATEANTIATEASAVAETELAVATAGASTAMKVFRTALLLTGIGLAIALIAGLVLAIRDNIKAAKDAKLAQEDLSKALESTEYGDAIKNVQSLTQNIKLAKEGLVDKNVVLKQYNETVGKTTGVLSNFNDIEQTLVKNTPAYIQMMLYKAAANIALEEAAKKAVEAEKIRLKSLEDFKNNITDNRISSGGAGGFGTGAFNPNDYDSETQRIEKAEKKRQDAKIKIETDAQQKQLDIATKFNQQVTETAKKNGFSIFGDAPPPAGSVAALEKRRDDLKALINLQKVGSQEQIASTKELIEVEKQLKAIEGHPGTNHNQIPNDFNSEVIAAQKKAIEEQSKNRAAGLKDDEAAFKAIADDESKSLGDRLFAYSQYIQKKKELVREEKDSQIKEAQNTITQLNAEVAKDNSLIAGSKLTASQKTSLQNKNNAITEQIKALNDSITRLTTERVTEQNTVESEGQKGIAAIVKNGSANMIKIKQAEISQIKADNQSAKDADLAALRQQLTNREITYKQYQEREKQISDEYNVKEQNQVKDKIEKELKILKDAGYDTVELQKELNAILKALYDANTKDFDDAEAKKEERRKKAHDLEKQLAEQTFETIKAFSDASYEKQVTQQQATLDAIEKTKQADIDRINNSVLSESEKQKQIAAINTKATQDEADQQRRINEIKRKQAVADKIFALAKIAENTAMGVAAVASTGGGTYYSDFGVSAAFLEGLVIALGAAQVAAVLATPLPSYEFGTQGTAHKGGPAVMFEGNKPELVLENGKAWIGSKEGIYDLSAGSHVISNKELMKIASQYSMGLPILIPQGGNGSALDTKQIVQGLDQVKQAIQDKPEHNWKMDWGGLDHLVKVRQSKQRWLNNIKN